MSASVQGGLFRELPATFGTYELLELLPGGGMSFVYKARTKIGKIVVVKILKPEENDPETHQRFTDEARTAAALNHPNIVSVYDFGDIDGRLFMVMEFLEGEDLSKLMAERRLTDPREKIRIGAEAARALRHVHQHGILHRDIKPGNIFVCSSGTVKLIDFGIAKSEFNTFKTRAGFTVGTLHYMAPEQVHGHADQRSDIYAFGLVLYQLLTGRVPVQGDTVQSIFYNILNEPLDLQPLSETAVPPRLIDLIRACTQKDPALRPASFDAVCPVMESLLAGPAPVASDAQQAPPTAAAKPAWQDRRLLAVAVLVPAAAIATWWLMSRSDMAAGARTAPLEAKTEAVVLPPSRTSPHGDMVLIPEGDFRFGKQNQIVNLPAFYMDRTEVTNRAWNEYCREHGCPEDSGDPSIPKTNVTFEAARTFCETVGKRLPTAEEWEKAARGATGHTYPWGHEQDTAHANVRPARSTGSVKPVGSHPSGASPYGALDMAGNVWEFVSNHRMPSPQELEAFRELGLDPPPTASEPWVVVYGGSYAGPLSHAADPALVPARYSDKTIGFRCAANP